MTQSPPSLPPSRLRPVYEPPRPTLRVPAPEKFYLQAEPEESVLPDRYESKDPTADERLSEDFGPVDEDILRYFERSRARRMGFPVDKDYPYSEPVEEFDVSFDDEDPEPVTQRKPRLSTFLAAVTMRV